MFNYYANLKKEEELKEKFNNIIKDKKQHDKRKSKFKFINKINIF